MKEILKGPYRVAGTTKVTRRIHVKLGKRGHYSTNIFLKSVTLHSGPRKVPVLPLDADVSIVASAIYFLREIDGYLTLLSFFHMPL